MSKFYYIIKKEILMVMRDPHSLAVLFLLPAAFILIMSLAMQDLFVLHTEKKINLLVASLDSKGAAQTFAQALGAGPLFTVSKATATNREQLVAEMYAKNSKYGLIIRPAFSEGLQSNAGVAHKPLELLALPTEGVHSRLVVKNSIAEKFISQRITTLLKGKENLLDYVGIKKENLLVKPDAYVDFSIAHKDQKKTLIPSSVQQNVPAWLVFAMFFIVIPISNAFISERNYGTSARMRSMHVPYGLLLAGKILPFLAINLIQALGMFLIGMYIVPLLGGDALEIQGSIAGLLCMTLSLSFCAIAYALLVATLSRTTEQATIIGGFGNIVLGAIGGIMVPKFVMPEIMQKLAVLSPLSWGLDGFLELLLKNGNLLDVVSHIVFLMVTGLFMLLLTWIIMQRTAAA